MRVTYLILINIFLFSCQANKKVNVNFLDKKIDNSEKIKLLLQVENIEIFKLNEEDLLQIKSIYSKRKFKPFWIDKNNLTSNAKRLKNEFAILLAYGLPQNRITQFSDTLHCVIQEIFLTKNLISVTNDLKNGFFNDSLKCLKPLSYSDSNIDLENLSKINNKEILILKLIECGPKDTIYQKLAHKLYDFVRNSNLNDSNIHVPTFKKDSILSFEIAKKALFQKSYLTDLTIDTLSFDSILKIFQSDNGLNPDGKIGQQTADALNETNLIKCQRTAISLEKLRWKKNDYTRLININIPEYKLRFYAEDTLKSVHRIIVGKEDKQTPELKSAIYKITTFPYWSVPFSITSEEFLPILKRNPNYLSNNNMKIYRKNEEIDPTSINWKNIREKTFPFKVIQQTGHTNSLGIIKFEFLNKYGVYVHDTPTKRLFSTHVRAYSHGCMRCEFPVILAKQILIKDNNDVKPEDLDTILFYEEHQSVPLKKRIPIIVEYISVIVNEKNELVFLRDIYKKDEEYLKIMF